MKGIELGHRIHDAAVERIPTGLKRSRTLLNNAKYISTAATGRFVWELFESLPDGDIKRTACYAAASAISFASTIKSADLEANVVYRGRDDVTNTDKRVLKTSIGVAAASTLLTGHLISEDMSTALATAALAGLSGLSARNSAQDIFDKKTSKLELEKRQERRAGRRDVIDTKFRTEDNQTAELFPQLATGPRRRSWSLGSLLHRR